MSTKKEVSDNPVMIDWPRDQHHITQKLKTAGLTACARVNAKKDKLAVLLATLDTLRDHAIARYKKDVKATKQQQVAIMARKQVEKENVARRKQKRIDEMEARLAALKESK